MTLCAVPLSFFPFMTLFFLPFLLVLGFELLVSRAMVGQHHLPLSQDRT